jgi:hypothetical protein
VEEAFKEVYRQRDNLNKETKDQSKDRNYKELVMGYVWVRFPNKNVWKRRYIRVSAS